MNEKVIVITGTSFREREMMLFLLEKDKGLQEIEKEESRRLSDIGHYIVNVDEMVLMPSKKSQNHLHVMSIGYRNPILDKGTMIRRMRKTRR